MRSNFCLGGTGTRNGKGESLVIGQLLLGSVITLFSIMTGAIMWGVLNEVLEKMEPWLRHSDNRFMSFVVVLIMVVVCIMSVTTFGVWLWAPVFFEDVSIQHAGRGGVLLIGSIYDLGYWRCSRPTAPEVAWRDDWCKRFFHVWFDDGNAHRHFSPRGKDAARLERLVNCCWGPAGVFPTR